MAYGFELAESVVRELDKLDPQQRKHILKFLDERVARLDNPRSVGEALHGSPLGEFGKYRAGNYRLICKIQDDRLVVLVLPVGASQKSIVNTSDFQPLGPRKINGWRPQRCCVSSRSRAFTAR